ncbi:MAG TPA: hypothetical protein V6D13_12870 [Halomicronema sp.]
MYPEIAVTNYDEHIYEVFKKSRLILSLIKTIRNPEQLVERE